MFIVAMSENCLILSPEWRPGCLTNRQQNIPQFIRFVCVCVSVLALLCHNFACLALGS